MNRKSFILIILASVFVLNEAFIDPFTVVSVVGAATVSGLLGGGFAVLKCKLFECCSKEEGWLTQNFTGLTADLDQYLYGQHLVKDMVVRALEHHLRNNNPQKALVMSFHGPTGTGKNFVSSLIAKHLYKKGLASAYVQFWIGKLNFNLENNLEKYSESIKQVLESKVRSCERSLFIIDEMDHIAPGVVDLLKPYLDFHEKINEVNYRKAVFIFISNTGSSNISSLAFQFKYNGQDREAMKMQDIRPLIENGAFNERGGLQHTAVISNSLVDLFVPFLPLEAEHVKQCIKSYLQKKGCPNNEDILKNIAEQLTYVPAKYEYFAKSGCKLISSSVAVNFDHPCKYSNTEF